MSHEVTEPIRALADIMHTIEEQGDYRLRTTDIGGDEVGQLARGFNTMLGALEVKNANINAELTERKKVQSRLDRLAHYDTLTQLPNRHYCKDSDRAGFGIGLTLAQRIASLHNGSLTYAREDSLTVFSLSLPTSS
jgi:signal transduction histidine kinase